MKNVIVGTTLLVVALGASAQTPPKAASGTAIIRNSISHTCADPNNPGIVFQQKDGGYLEAPQGWFTHAEVHQSTSWAIAYCYYGWDKANPTARPAYSVHYELTNFKSNQCRVNGRTVSCGIGTVLKP